MWYVRDVLYAVLYVRVSCFVVRGCGVNTLVGTVINTILFIILLVIIYLQRIISLYIYYQIKSLLFKCCVGIL